MKLLKLTLFFVFVSTNSNAARVQSGAIKICKKISTYSCQSNKTSYKNPSAVGGVLTQENVFQNLAKKRLNKIQLKPLKKTKGTISIQGNLIKCTQNVVPRFYTSYTNDCAGIVSLTNPQSMYNSFPASFKKRTNQNKNNDETTFFYCEYNNPSYFIHRIDENSSCKVLGDIVECCQN